MQSATDLPLATFNPRRRGAAQPTDSGRRLRLPSVRCRAALLLATEPLDKVTGRVTYSQEILKEFGWIDEAAGLGVDTPGTGYSRL